MGESSVRFSNDHAAPLGKNDATNQKLLVELQQVVPALLLGHCAL